MPGGLIFRHSQENTKQTLGKSAGGVDFEAFAGGLMWRIPTKAAPGGGFEMPDDDSLRIPLQNQPEAPF